MPTHKTARQRAFLAQGCVAQTQVILRQMRKQGHCNRIVECHVKGLKIEVFIVDQMGLWHFVRQVLLRQLDVQTSIQQRSGNIKAIVPGRVKIPNKMHPASQAPAANVDQSVRGFQPLAQKIGKLQRPQMMPQSADKSAVRVF